MIKLIITEVRKSPIPNQVWCKIQKVDTTSINPPLNMGWCNIDKPAYVGKVIATNEQTLQYSREMVILRDAKTKKPRLNDLGAVMYSFKCIKVKS